MPLSPERAALVRLSGALGSRRPEGVRRALRHAADAAPPAAVDEALLQAHLFIGFPDALNAFFAWREIEPHPGAEAEGERSFLERGEEVCATVYGESYEPLRGNVRQLHPDLDLWMVSGGYGRVLGRPGLDLATRELCVVALLAAWEAPRQLHSHLRGALNAGAASDEVEEALEAGLAWRSEEERARPRVLLRKVTGARV
jgi:4-carboxymuconolactone decarboxylase